MKPGTLVDEDLSSGTWNTDFNKLLGNFSRVVVLGDPGAGKSTTSGVTALNWMKSKTGNAFYIRLREAVKEQHGFDLVAHIRLTMATRHQLGEITDDAVRAMLASPNTLLVFDGLDEVLLPHMRRATSPHD
jgi:predicted NACHT family NTPase